MYSQVVIRLLHTRSLEFIMVYLYRSTQKSKGVSVAVYIEILWIFIAEEVVLVRCKPSLDHRQLWT